VDFTKDYLMSIKPVSTLSPPPPLHTEADDRFDKQGSGQLVAGKPLEEFFWVCDKSISIVPRRPFLIKYCHPHPDYKQNPNNAFLSATLDYFRSNSNINRYGDRDIYEFTYQNRTVTRTRISEEESIITVKTKLPDKTLIQSFKTSYDFFHREYYSPLPNEGVSD
jgi:hypothetical protein